MLFMFKNGFVFNSSEIATIEKLDPTTMSSAISRLTLKNGTVKYISKEEENNIVEPLLYNNEIRIVSKIVDKDIWEEK